MEDRRRKPEAPWCNWLLTTFNDGEINRFRLDEGDLPPGILSEGG